MVDLKIANESRQDQLSNIKKYLYFKDRYCISDRSYTALTQLNHDIPTIIEIIKYRNSLNSLFSVKAIDNGVFLDIKDAIQFKLLKYLDSVDTVNDEILKIKLSADATNIGRFNKIINFTFTIINETSKAKSAAGNYTLGIISCESNEETYDRIKLPYVMEQI
jgi:hypothetical protein